MDEKQEKLIEQFGAEKAAAGGRLKVSDASKAISSRIISEFGVIGAFHLGGRTGSRSTPLALYGHLRTSQRRTDQTRSPEAMMGQDEAAEAAQKARAEIKYLKSG